MRYNITQKSRALTVIYLSARMISVPIWNKWMFLYMGLFEVDDDCCSLFHYLQQFDAPSKGVMKKLRT